ncbi:hypothetical protein LTR10_022599 [Elasticomyces elasticus]|nr:hypothetical protein LTR10_022599 [Elasticomyces elasticus]KAK5027690.1 hypothetical protein LTR13_009397 [Exophiala sideris]KAK5177981.1 hypothetical protein LTR44_009530 [Eurotiomycetes sp. CCFEE 6388]
MTRQKFVKISIFCHKRADITDEEFHQYWAVEHPKEVRKCRPFMDKVWRYNQYHVTPDMRKEAATIEGMKALDYDGYAEFWVDDIKDWKAMIAAEDGLLTLVEDEAKFMQHPLDIMYGYEELIIGAEIPFNTKDGTQ